LIVAQLRFSNNFEINLLGIIY